MKFEEIVDSVSFEDIEKAMLNENAILFDHLRRSSFQGEKIQPVADSFSVEEARKNVAVYAKLIKEHVGYDGFGNDNIQKFQEEIEKLYNNLQSSIPAQEFAKQLNKLQVYIMDNHCILVTPTYENVNQNSKNKQAEPKYPKKEKIEGYTHLYSEVFYDGKVCSLSSLSEQQQEQSQKICEIGQINQNGERILLVQFPSFGGRSGYYKEWQDFIENFDKIYGENGKDWDRIILDVRGNPGGEDKPISHIAQRTYGNRVNSYKRCEIIDSKLSDYIYKQHGIFTRFRPENLEVLSRHNFSNKKRALFDETKTYYTFNEKQGYRGSIDILIDRGVGSAAESAYTLFYHHPKIRYIGENTKGMQQYQQGWTNLPCGYGLRLGVTKLTYWDKDGENIECIGHKPDICCSTANALNEALTNPLLPFQHELNEIVPPEAKTPAPNGVNPYDPKEPEKRKSYSAIYVEPELERIEFENIISSLSKEDLIATPKIKQQNEYLTLSERRRMLAYIGRFFYNAHGGFATENPNIVFPEAVKQKFIKEFLKLYNSEQEKTLRDNLKDVFKFLMTCVPDNHANLFDSNGAFFHLTPEEDKQLTIELKDILKKDDLDVCQRGKIERYLSQPHQVGQNIVKQSVEGLSPSAEGMQWKIGTLEKDGKEFFVVGISSFAAFNQETGAFDKDLIDDFTNLAKELSKKEYKDKDGLILDLRGNRGGWPYIGDYLARILYGNTVTSGGDSLKRDTLEREIVSSHMRGSFEQDKNNIVQKYFSEKTIENKVEKWTETFPFNPQQGIISPIVVLTDRDTGSNAEATCEKLSAHPCVKFVGENTKGCLQFGGAPTGTTALPLPYGGRLGIPLGACSSSIIQGRYEGIGIAPHYKPPKGCDALLYAIELFDDIKQDIDEKIKSLPQCSKKTPCLREAYVDNLTEKNVELMQNTGNFEAAEAVRRLSDVTKNISSTSLSEILTNLVLSNVSTENKNKKSIQIYHKNVGRT